MAVLTLEPTSYSIVATVSELDAEYVGWRKFVWALDGEVVKTETVTTTEGEGIESHSYEILPVYFNSEHSVTVTVSGLEDDPSYVAPDPDPDDPDAEPEPVPQIEVVWFESTVSTWTLIPAIDGWAWYQSNGEATNEATELAHDTADESGQCEYFGYKVWDDLVDKVAEAIQQTGQTWRTTYGSAEETKIGVQYGGLTAKMFNCLVNNINYPYWTWRHDQDSEGYLGRLLVQASSGETLGDIVYGYYMLELAQRLNTVISIYNDTANIREVRKVLFSSLTTSAGLLTKPSVRFSKSLGMDLDWYSRLDSIPSSRLAKQVSMNLDIVATAEAKLLCEGIGYVTARLIFVVEGDASPSVRISATLTMGLTQGATLARNNSTAIFSSGVTSQLSSAANMTKWYIAALMATDSYHLVISAEGDTQAVKLAGGYIYARHTVSGTALATPYLAYGSVVPIQALLGVSAEGDTAPPVYIAGGADAVLVISAEALETDLTTIIDGGTALTLSHNGLFALGDGLGFETNLESTLSFQNNLAVVQFVAMEASLEMALNATAKEGDSQPSSDWEYPVETEDGLEIFQTMYTYRGKDRVFIDFLYTAEGQAAMTAQLTANAQGVASKGWDFPDQYKRVLTIYQALGVEQTDDEIEVE